tara:strand:+ start:593 stop:979 length:387 start_codon:yes stop_codon:yes gene_type:complete
MSKYISAEDNQMKYDQGAIIAYGSVYSDGKPAILIKGAEDGAPVAKATVNIEDIATDLMNRIVVIKDYSENVGVLDTLQDTWTIRVLKHIDEVAIAYILDDSIVQEIKEASEKIGKPIQWIEYEEMNS